MPNPFNMLWPQSDSYQDYEQGRQYFEPFYNTGVNAMNQYSNTLSNLLQHPTGLENRVMSTYHMSPWARYQTQTLGNMANNQAALAGNLGTPDAQKALMQQEQGIVSKDQQQYLQNAYAPYEWGLQGEQYLTGMGLQAGEGMARQKNLEALLSQMQSGNFLQTLGIGLGGLGKYAMTNLL